MWRYRQEPMGTSDPDPEPRHTGLPPRRCPFSVYEYPCLKTDCLGCTIRIEAQAKARGDREIADNLKSFWANLSNHSEK